jgi:hypothetical protein
MPQDSNDLVGIDVRAGASPPLFIYTITPREVYTSAGTKNPVTLYITVYNPKSNGFIGVTDIEFAISIGSQRNDLTADHNDVEGQSDQSEWTIEKLSYEKSPLIFKVTPAQGTTGLAPNTSIGFGLTGINVNDAEGGAPIFIAETTAHQTGLGEKTINKVSPSLQINLFQVIPASLQPGTPATLSWATSGASSCIIDQLNNSVCSPPEPPPSPLPLSGSLQICPRETTTYTLTAYDEGGGHTQAQATVTVTDVQILSFTSNPTTIDILNAPSTLEWEVLNAVSLRLDPGAINVTGKTSYPVTPEVETTYTLTAQGAVGLVSQPTTVYVETPVINSFTSAPAEVARGEPVTLSWATAHANSCSIDQGVGRVAPASGGHTNVSLQEQTTYTLTANGLGAPATAQLTIAPQPQAWIKQPAPPDNAVTPTLTVFQGKLWFIDVANQLVLTSADGHTWTPVTMTHPFSGVYLPMRTVVFNNRMWIIGSLSPNPYPVWSSEDGANWSSSAPSEAGLFPRYGGQPIVFNDQLLLMGGYDGSGEIFNDVWASADGLKWTHLQPSAPWSPRSLMGLAIYNNELWVCGGQALSGAPIADAWHSPDGVTWKQWKDGAQLPWAPRAAPGLQAINGRLYLISGAGLLGANPVNDMWVMDANMNWQQVPAGTPNANWIGGGVTVFNWRLWMTPCMQQFPAEVWAFNP